MSLFVENEMASRLIRSRGDRLTVTRSQRGSCYGSNCPKSHSKFLGTGEDTGEDAGSSPVRSGIVRLVRAVSHIMWSKFEIPIQLEPSQCQAPCSTNWFATSQRHPEGIRKYRAKDTETIHSHNLQDLKSGSLSSVEGIQLNSLTV